MTNEKIAGKKRRTVLQRLLGKYKQIERCGHLYKGEVPWPNHGEVLLDESGKPVSDVYDYISERNDETFEAHRGRPHSEFGELIYTLDKSGKPVGEPRREYPRPAFGMSFGGKG